MRRNLFAIGLFVLSLAAVPPAAKADSLPVEKELEKLPPGSTGEVIRYGYELLANTPEYIGPKGKVKPYAKTLMACRNCHIDVGMRPSGNSFLDTHGLYPQYRGRERKVVSLAERVNGCLKHPLQGNPLPLDSPEMNAILLYIKWLGRGRPLLERDPDERLPKLALLNRAADPDKGREVYANACMRCHGLDGQGKLRPDGAAYLYPPLWGDSSFPYGAGMSRLSLLARFVKANMPFGVVPDKPLLTDEQAWDVGAFVLSQPRPEWVGKTAYPDPAQKPFDFPFGPYADQFDSAQHRFGPFLPIQDYWAARTGSRDVPSGP